MGVIPDAIDTQDIRKAAEALNSGGFKHAFHESTTYDVVIDGQLYPPKAVIGVAAKIATGVDLEPSSFRGGKGTECFRVLERLGFEIRPKPNAEKRNEAPWDDDELRTACRSYLQMLELQQKGQTFNKSEIRRAAIKDGLARNQRTEASFETRMRNISAVLAELQHPIVKGYLPASHVGQGVTTRLRGILAELFDTDLSRLGESGETNQLAKAARCRARLSPVAKPRGRRSVQTRQASQTVYVRDHSVVVWVLQEADGRCELCRALAPFTDEFGNPFLEVHHVRMLAHGGSDTVENAVALCPNCHRRLHYGADREKAKQSLYSNVPRLIIE